MSKKLFKDLDLFNQIDEELIAEAKLQQKKLPTEQSRQRKHVVDEVITGNEKGGIPQRPGWRELKARLALDPDFLLAVADGIAAWENKNFKLTPGQSKQLNAAIYEEAFRYIIRNIGSWIEREKRAPKHALGLFGFVFRQLVYYYGRVPTPGALVDRIARRLFCPRPPKTTSTHRIFASSKLSGLTERRVGNLAQKVIERLTAPDVTADDRTWLSDDLDLIVDELCTRVSAGESGDERREGAIEQLGRLALGLFASQDPPVEKVVGQLVIILEDCLRNSTRRAAVGALKELALACDKNENELAFTPAAATYNTIIAALEARRDDDPDTPTWVRNDCQKALDELERGRSKT